MVMGESEASGEQTRCMPGLKQGLEAQEWIDREKKSGSSRANGDTEM